MNEVATVPVDVSALYIEKKGAEEMHRQKLEV